MKGRESEMQVECSSFYHEQIAKDEGVFREHMAEYVGKQHDPGDALLGIPPGPMYLYNCRDCGSTVSASYPPSTTDLIAQVHRNAVRRSREGWRNG